MSSACKTVYPTDRIGFRKLYIFGEDSDPTILEKKKRCLLIVIKKKDIIWREREGDVGRMW